MKAFTYYNHIQSLHDPDLVECWKRSWAKWGWEPIVLTQDDAKNADLPMYIRFCGSPLLNSCPGNPKEYTLAAMLRWIPMTVQTEPCIHLDWDVMCNGLKPEDVIIHDPVPTFLAGSTCPCAIAANPRGWKLFAASLEIAPFLPNFNAEELLRDSCDQYAASILPPDLYFVQRNMQLCKLYLEEAGWETAKMIHFANRLTPRPRSAVVRGLGIA